MFPNIDPEHTWSTAENRSITVSTDAPSDIWIYTPDGATLLAHYYDVEGETKVSFDIDFDTKRVLVTDEYMAYMVDLDGHIDFGTATRSNRNILIPMEPVARYCAPMGNDFLELPVTSKDRKMYRSMGAITIYAAPQYGDYGIFYYDSHKEIIRVPVNGMLSDKTLGVRMDIPVGMVYGLYKQLSDGRFVYSDSKLNEPSLEDRSFFDDMAVSYEKSLMTRADEDPGDPNLDGNAVSAVYYFAFEDLGGTDDFDFNDVVIKVEYGTDAFTNRSSNITLSLMAVGGTLNVHSTYTGEIWSGSSGQTLTDYPSSAQPSSNISLFDGKELHKAYADDNPSAKNNATKIPMTPINVTGPNCITGLDPIQHEVCVPPYYSVASNMTKYRIQVEQENGTTAEIKVPNPEDDEIPQVILVCLINKSNSTWEWPAENQSIIEKYDIFSQWISNHELSNWPNFMWDSDTKNIIYETPYFWASLSATNLNANNKESADLIVTPKRADYDINISSDNNGVFQTENSTGTENGLKQYKSKVKTENTTLSGRGQLVFNITQVVDGFTAINEEYTFWINVEKSGDNQVTSGILTPEIDYSLSATSSANQGSTNTGYYTPPTIAEGKGKFKAYIDFKDYELSERMNDDEYYFEMTINLKPGGNTNNVTFIQWGYYKQKNNPDDPNEALEFVPVISNNQNTGTQCSVQNNPQSIIIHNSISVLRELMKTKVLHVYFDSKAGNSITFQPTSVVDFKIVKRE